MFPKYIEKSGSKKHAQFLFGNTQTDRLFKDYSKLRFEHDASRGSIRPRDNSKNRSIEPIDQNNKSVFDIYLSDAKNISNVNASVFDIRNNSAVVNSTYFDPQSQTVLMKNDV
jgi:hypothetical protein